MKIFLVFYRFTRSPTLSPTEHRCLFFGYWLYSFLHLWFYYEICDNIIVVFLSTLSFVSCLFCCPVALWLADGFRIYAYLGDHSYECPFYLFMWVYRLMFSFYCIFHMLTYSIYSIHLHRYFDNLYVLLIVFQLFKYFDLCNLYF